MNTHDELRGALRRRADGVGWEAADHPLSLDDVRGRARGIRRRRTAVSGLAVAAVLAIAVPVGLSTTGSTGTAPPLEPARPRPTETVPAPADPTEVVLTTDVPVGEAAPGIAYVHRDTLVTPGDGTSEDPGARLRLDSDYLEIAPLADGWWVGVRPEGYHTAVDVLDASGEVTWSGRGRTGLATSPDGTVVAFAAPDGRILTVVAGEEPTELYDGVPSDVAAVVGSESCDPESAGGGCVVHANTVRDAENFTITSKGILSDVPALLTVRAVGPDGQVSGITSYDDLTGSCGAVVGPDGKRAWETCDHTLGGFSPDGRYVLGLPAMRDGAGDARVAILDADTGAVVAQTTNSEDAQAFASSVRWDVDSTLLMVVDEGESSRIVRLTPKGQLVAAVAEEFPMDEAFVSDLRLADGP